MVPLYALKPDSSHLITKDKVEIERAIAARLPRQRTIPSDRGVALSLIADKLVRGYGVDCCLRYCYSLMI